MSVFWRRSSTCGRSVGPDIAPLRTCRAQVLFYYEPIECQLIVLDRFVYTKLLACHSRSVRRGTASSMLESCGRTRVSQCLTITWLQMRERKHCTKILPLTIPPSRLHRSVWQVATHQSASSLHAWIATLNSPCPFHESQQTNSCPRSRRFQTCSGGHRCNSSLGKLIFEGMILI